MASPRTHHRSASWTLGGAAAAATRPDGGGGGEGTTFDSLRSVICEIVPGLSAGAQSSIPPQTAAGDGRGDALSGRESVLMMEDLERGNPYSPSAAGTHAYRRTDSHAGGSFPNGAGMQPNGSNGENGDADDGTPTSLQPILKWFEKGLPFCLLLAGRLIWEHRLGKL